MEQAAQTEVTLADLHNDHIMQVGLALYKIEIASAHAMADGVTVPPEPPLVAQARTMIAATGNPAPAPATSAPANPQATAPEAAPTATTQDASPQLVATYVNGQLQMVDPTQVNQ